VSTADADPGADRFGLVGKRVVVGSVVGIAAAVLALVERASWAVAVLCASDFAALVFIVWVWITVAGADAATTARLARAEDASRAAAEAVLIGAGAASLIAVAFTLVQAGSTHAPARGLLSALAIGSVALAWTSIQTVYLLRYARSYYSPPDGGIDFHGETPDYLDFAYLAHHRDVLPGVRHRSHRKARPPLRITPRAAVIPIRDRDRGGRGQPHCRLARALADPFRDPPAWCRLTP
jgi:uncharacterized membrane protein